jgi:hypothetical protein
MTWRLKRTQQCRACPWRVATDPARDIPNGYGIEKHRALASTIATPGSWVDNPHVMACHETEDSYCVGWLVNQLGDGNNIPLRIRMRDCENAGNIRLRGGQHGTFEDTLPE